VGKVVSPDVAFFSIGRIGATAELGLEAVGVAVDDRGASRSTSTSRPRPRTSTPRAT
jgi:pyruvate/2-oxoglutarate dehydrogenase complex dihydrolipoamide dehydrogenase (E3) component